MFGIGKKKETLNTGVKVEKKGAEQEIQFDFEENDKLPFDDEEEFTDEDFADEDEAPPRKGLREALSSRTLLLSLLLLLVLGGGGYYFLNSPLAPPAPKPAAPIKTTVTVQPATPAPVVVQPVTPEVKSATKAPVAASPAAAVAVQPVSPAPAVKTDVPVVAEQTSKSVIATPVAPLATTQPFTLSAGSFVSQKNLRAVEKKIRSLGYTPKVQATYTMVTMTRLLLGVYDDPAAAQARSRELSTLIPDLFSLRQGDSVALYAGSYQDIEEARHFADRLKKHGILVDEETISLRMPVKNVRYGSFDSRAAAKQAAKRADRTGLTSQVVKR